MSGVLEYVAELVTKTPHNRIPGQNVVLNNVLVGSIPSVFL
jgi:hypothetical protein